MNDEIKNEPSTCNTKPCGLKSCVLPFIIGFFVGMAFLGILGWKMMPGMMITVHESKYGDVEQTCKALKAAVEENGWYCPAIRNLNKSMAKQGVTIDRQVRLVELCNAKHASEVLKANPEVSTLMPCAWGVYQGDDGKVYIAGMNMGLMGKMFGGKIAEVMGGSVATDEAKMLKDVVK